MNNFYATTQIIARWEQEDTNGATPVKQPLTWAIDFAWASFEKWQTSDVSVSQSDSQTGITAVDCANQSHATLGSLSN